MSDEDSLLQRFNRCFWWEYIEGFKSLEFQIEKSRVSRDVQAVIDECRQLADNVRFAGFLVSRNENLEDVTSAGLLFLVIPYAIGDLLCNHSGYDRDNRISVLTEVRAYWDSFLLHMEQLSICMELISTDERSRKIESQLRQNELQKVVSRLHYRICRSGISADVDEYRDDVISMLEFFALKARNEIRFVLDEMALLESKAGDKQECVKPSSQGNKKLWSMKLDKTLIKSMMQKQVFRPDITLPTVSLEEFAQMEYTRAVQSKSVDVVGKRVSDENYYAIERMEELKEAEKARAWDDWKDENPRGAGNKLVNNG